MLKPVDQIAIGNNFGAVTVSGEGREDTLGFWCEVYFAHAVTTTESSRRVQRRDLSLFMDQRERTCRNLRF